MDPAERLPKSGPPSTPRFVCFRARRLLAVAAAAIAALAAGGVGVAHPTTVRADVTFDSALFNLINQDRAQAGVPGLRWNSQLSAIAENQPYSGCGFSVAGRAEDMIVRNYFSHTICGTQNVFNVMQADGLQFGWAGENIGWESGYTDPQQAATYLNQQYMQSPEHRANILSTNYTDVGVGSWSTAPGRTWSGGGSTGFTNVTMSVEDFASLPSSSAPSAVPPAPAPTSPPASGTPPNAAGLVVVAADGTMDPIVGASSLVGGGMWSGRDVIRGVALRPDGASGYALDDWGGIHPFGPQGSVPPNVLLGGYWPGWDIARGIVLRPDGASGYVLDGWGGIHPFASTVTNMPPPVILGGYWPGWDIARGIVLRSDGVSGYVLDGWGGIHPFGSTAQTMAPPVHLGGYWPGWDIARGIALGSDGVSGQVVEGWGGVHPFGNAPQTSLTGYRPGHDTYRGIALLPGSSTAGYTIDSTGGIWPVGGAPGVGGDPALRPLRAVAAV